MEKLVYSNGDIIDINQTVNGCSTFVVYISSDGYNVKYYYDGKPQRDYEYDIQELLDLDNLYDSEIKIIGNIF